MVCSMFYRGIHYAKYNWLGKVGDGCWGKNKNPGVGERGGKGENNHNKRGHPLRQFSLGKKGLHMGFFWYDRDLHYILVSC